VNTMLESGGSSGLGFVGDGELVDRLAGEAAGGAGVRRDAACKIPARICRTP
jgi:hypothetical protein